MYFLESSPSALAPGRLNSPNLLLWWNVRKMDGVAITSCCCSPFELKIHRPSVFPRRGSVWDRGCWISFGYWPFWDYCNFLILIKRVISINNINVNFNNLFLF